MADLFGNPEQPAVPMRNRSGSFNINPCIQAFGLGGDGVQCKDCKHLVSVGGTRKYYKCALRAINNSATTDHQKRWPACARFEKTGETEKGQLVTSQTQLIAIKRLFEAGKRLTVQSVLRAVGTQELRTYVPILKRAPYNLDIASEWTERNDKRFKEYYLRTA